MKKRFIAFLLVLTLSLSLFCGCGINETVLTESEEMQESFESEETQEPSEKTNIRETNFFNHDIKRADVAFSEMNLDEPYDRTDFDEAIDRLYELADCGGSEEDFRVLDDFLLSELSFLNDREAVSMHKFYLHPSDESYQEAYQDATELYELLNDRYKKAIASMAQSEYCDLLLVNYSEKEIAKFAKTDAKDDSRLQFLLAEQTLVEEYNTLISEDLPDYDRIGELYVELVTLRREYTESKGYDNPADYYYTSDYSRLYTPKDAQNVHEAVKEYLVPIYRKYVDYNEDIDSTVIPQEIENVEEKVFSAMEYVLPQISSELMEAYEYMQKYGLVDFAASEDRVDTGYVYPLVYFNEPVLYNAGYSSYLDYTYMFHEMGHYANAFYQENALQDSWDLDFAEVQSQGLELLATKFYPEIFGENIAKQLEFYLVYKMLNTILSGCLFDEFQQIVYTESDLTPERCCEIYMELLAEYGLETETSWEVEWMDVPHNFEDPFYYLSYAVSAIGAMDIYALLKQDEEAAMDTYLTICSMNLSEHGFLEAMEKVGFSDPFGDSFFKDFSKQIDKALADLS